ncbi:MAG: HRDC domain-containing protein [Dehalococcoidia bacterium]
MLPPAAARRPHRRAAAEPLAGGRAGRAQADDKLARLLEICTEERGSGIVYTATRDRAEEVARVLRTHGVSARHYHAGMTREERADTQDAFMLGRLRVIAATVAFGMGVDKPDVRFIAHVNPSRSLEAYAQESGRAGRDGEPARCILFWSPRDATTLARWARDDALTPALLQAVHRAVWAGVRGPFAWHTAERLARTVGDALGGHEPLDETTLRVALGALEQVGVLRRHCDLPEQFRLRLLDGGHPLAAALDAAEGERLIIDPFDLAGMLGVTAAEVEERLLAFQDDGALTVQGLGRGMLLERLPHPPDLAQRLKALLDGRAQSQADRLHQMEAYATARTCRAALIAHHFGVEHAGRCGNCDICRDGAGPARPVRRQGVDRAKPRAGVPPPTERAPEDLILECVAELPFAMGRTGVCRVLKGSIKSPVQADRSRQFGALAAMAEAAIEREIERMVDAGWLVRDDSEYRRLSVTPAGFAKPPAPWPPPQAAPDASAAPAGVGDDDPATIDRFERLRAWRATTAREAGLPAYTVFHDATLRLIAARVVRSVRDLQGISGIGPAKLERYGAALVELLADA